MTTNRIIKAAASAVNRFYSTMRTPSTWRKGMAGGVMLMAGLSFQSNAYALLISGDSSYGAGTVTVDTDTNLEWLDPVLAITHGGTCCRSYNEMSAEFGSGGVFEGYRFATAGELETLFFVSAGIDLSSASADQSIADLISLMDNTRSTMFGPTTFFATSGYYDSGNPDEIGLASLEAEQTFGTWMEGDAFITLSADSPDVNGGPFGAWMVRDLSVVTVDEPGPALLFLMAGLAGWAARRNARN